MTGTARKDVVSLRVNNPHMKGSEIARLVGISRERVRQILNTQGLLVRSVPRVRPCKVCGKPITHSHAKYYCSRACFHRDHQVLLVCSTCGKHFLIPTSDYTLRLRDKKTNRWYCSKKCQGKWLGQLRWGNIRCK